MISDYCKTFLMRSFFTTNINFFWLVVLFLYCLMLQSEMLVVILIEGIYVFIDDDVQVRAAEFAKKNCIVVILTDIAIAI